MLDLHIGQVKFKDFYWIREKFGGIELAELSLAITQDVMPQKDWKIIGHDEEYVVADFERSLVFDALYGEEVSAGTSLLIAGDTKYQPTRAVLEDPATPSSTS